ncbi:MAG: hypothetical protein WCP89_04025 [archaeon]
MDKKSGFTVYLDEVNQLLKKEGLVFNAKRQWGMVGQYLIIDRISEHFEAHFIDGCSVQEAINKAGGLVIKNVNTIT